MRIKFWPLIVAFDILCWSAIVALWLAMAGCGGGGSDAAVAAAVAPVAPLSVPCNPSINCPEATPPGSGTQTLPTCGVGVSGSCQCADGEKSDNGSCPTVPVATLPACAADAPIAQCVCEAPDTANALGVCIPPPTQCPTEQYGTPPNCLPIPQCSAVVGGYWGGPQAGCECPASETGTYPQCVGQPCPAGTYGTPGNCLIQPVCNFPGSYWGGNACECPATYTGVYPSCLPPPTACSTFDPSATGNFPNCGCPSGEVWANSSCITPTISCTSYPPANGVWPSCSCPAPDMWNNAALACQLPSQPDTLACTAGSDSSGNPDSTCVYSSPNPVDECDVWDMTAQSGPYVLTGSGQGISQGTVEGPAILQPTTFSLQCTLTQGTTATVTP